MPRIRFTANLRRHLETPELDAPGRTVREVLDAALKDEALLRSYVLDDQGRLRRHVTIFVAGVMIADRAGLTDPVAPDAEIYVLQALSGG
ncbi:MAG: MoaD/ThiS family protein [Mangrovicoccus sp.]|nr:MoaD/ThiS family protein [Mangrovicoccus sp.]